MIVNVNKLTIKQNSVGQGTAMKQINNDPFRAKGKAKKETIREWTTDVTVSVPIQPYYKQRFIFVKHRGISKLHFL